MPASTNTFTVSLSPGFQAVLDERSAIKGQMDGTQLVIAALCVLLAVRVRRPIVASLVVTALCVISPIAAGAHLDRWWQSLNRIATLDADHAWLADHDGGMMILNGLALLGKAGITWLLSLVLIVAVRRRRKTEGIHAPGVSD